MDNEFDKIEILEKNGIGKIFLNDVLIKCLTEYEITRDADMIDIKINISVPAKNLEIMYL